MNNIWHTLYGRWGHVFLALVFHELKLSVCMCVCVQVSSSVWVFLAVHVCVRVWHVHS